MLKYSAQGIPPGTHGYDATILLLHRLRTVRNATKYILLWYRDGTAANVHNRSLVSTEGSFSATSITEQSVSDESELEEDNRKDEREVTLTDEGSDEDTDWDSAMRFVYFFNISSNNTNTLPQYTCIGGACPSPIFFAPPQPHRMDINQKSNSRENLSPSFSMRVSENTPINTPFWRHPSTFPRHFWPLIDIYRLPRLTFCTSVRKSRR